MKALRGKGKETKSAKSTSTSVPKRWSGQFSNVSTSSDGGTPLTLDGLLEHERAMDNSKCSTAYGLSRLKRTDPSEWTVSDVGVWLDWLSLSEYRAEFMKNAVSGAELKELDNADFISLGINKVGHRKKLERRVKMLQHGLDPMGEDDDGNSSHSSSHSSIQSSHSTNSKASHKSSASASVASEGYQAKLKKDKITLKCVFKDDISLLHVSPLVEFAELGKKIKKEYGRMMEIKYKDAEGDLIRVKTTKGLRSAIKNWSGEGSLKLLLSEKKKKITKRNADIMDTMIDAVITIDPKGKILVFNKKAEEIFGYRKKQVLKKNVNMLMPPHVALSHDGYLKTYKRTKKRHIIGIGRQVNARHSDGHEFPIHLSISESKTNDDTLFTATIRLITAEATREAAAVESASTSTAGGVSTASPSDMAMFGLLDCLLDSTVVINQNGIIKFWNKAASERLGFSKEEVVGKNIKMCMPASIADKHDAYIQRYMATGEGKVVGVGRNVVAQKKNGEIVPVHLSLTEQQIGPDQRYFTGVMRAVEEELEQKKTVLQQEREVMDGLAVPAMISDETGKIHGFNSALTGLLGYNLIDVIGRSRVMLMPADTAKEHEGFIQSFLKSGDAGVLREGRDLVCVHKDGSMLPLHLSVNAKKDGPKYLFTTIFQKM